MEPKAPVCINVSTSHVRLDWNKKTKIKVYRSRNGRVTDQTSCGLEGDTTRFPQRVD